MNVNEMAAKLRSMGWVCTPPSGHDAEPPPVATGQIWIYGNGRDTLRREIIDQAMMVGGLRCVLYWERGRQRHMPWDGFLAWIRDTGARPQETAAGEMGARP